MMRAYVLHLTRAKARRDNARALLQDCGVAGEIWPAVDGAALDPADLRAQYRPEVFWPVYPFELRMGEIGCFLSHRQIWADMQDRREDCALIIEDDAGIEQAMLTRALDLAQRHIARRGYIQLQTRAHRGPTLLLDTNGPAALTLPRLPGLRTTAQVVSKQAAAQLLKHSRTFDRPVDTFVQSHWQTGLRAAMIHPSGVSEIAGRLDGSTIQNAQKGLLEKMRREVARALYRRAARRAALHSDAPRGGADD